VTRPRNLGMSEKPTIKQIMAAVDISQEQIALRLGVSQSRVSRMLKPKADLRLSTIKRVAKAMGVSWQDLAATYHDPDEESLGDEN
jgi:transcriptional regulator with XRE-family HTH domain